MQRQYSLNEQYYSAEDLFNFIKYITKCNPSSLIQPNSRLPNNNNNDEDLLKKWMKDEDLLSVGVRFKSINDYKSTFFRLIVEECRQSKSQSDNNESTQFTVYTLMAYNVCDMSVFNFLLDMFLEAEGSWQDR